MNCTPVIAPLRTDTDASAWAGPVDIPIVFIDAAPEPMLRVIEYTRTAPFDRVHVVIASLQPEPDPVDMHRWLHAHAAIAIPHRTTDGLVAWQTLAQGTLEEIAHDGAADAASRHLILHDDADRMMQQGRLMPLRLIASDASPSQTTLTHDASTNARMQIGRYANCSHDTYVLHDDDPPVHVLEADGQPWTLGAALASVAAFAHLPLDVSLLPTDLADARLIESIDLTQPLEAILQPLLDRYALIASRTRTGPAARTHARWAILPIEHGRAIDLAWAGPDQPLAQVERITSTSQRAAARTWTLEADPRRIESTFELHKGWDPALEPAPGDIIDPYDPDQAHLANVYRLWVLNEDHAYSAAPFNAPVFDLADFFDEPELKPQPLSFDSCITADPSGYPKSRVVEISTDDGVNWSPFPGASRSRYDRAAIYLTAPELPPEFIYALETGVGRLRVTASLESPQPVAVTRETGNPRLGRAPVMTHRTQGAFRFRGIDVESRFHAAVQSGLLQSTEADDTDAMAHWFDIWIQRQMFNPEHTAGRGQLQLSGAWTALKPGDRIRNPAGPNQAIDAAERRQRDRCIIHEVRCVWPAVDFEGASQPDTVAGPGTTVTVHAL